MIIVLGVLLGLNLGAIVGFWLVLSVTWFTNMSHLILWLLIVLAHGIATLLMCWRALVGNPSYLLLGLTLLISCALIVGLHTRADRHMRRHFEQPDAWYDAFYDVLSDMDDSTK